MKKSIGVLLLPAIFAISGCVVVPARVEDRSGYPYQQPYEQSYQQPVSGEEMVEVPVIYGEPVYYPPPFVVRYTYDYYTYENVGGYVNIVFWRNGHRFRNEPWYDHGRRMRIEHMREWEHNHRIPVRDFEHHRKTLEYKHHITHPDTFYGRRPVGPLHPVDKKRDVDRLNPPKRDIDGRFTPQQRQTLQQQQAPQLKQGEGPRQFPANRQNPQFQQQQFQTKQQKLPLHQDQTQQQQFQTKQKNFQKQQGQYQQQQLQTKKKNFQNQQGQQHQQQIQTRQQQVQKPQDKPSKHPHDMEQDKNQLKY